MKIVVAKTHYCQTLYVCTHSIRMFQKLRKLVRLRLEDIWNAFVSGFSCRVTDVHTVNGPCVVAI